MEWSFLEAPFVAHWSRSKATLRKPLRDGVEQVWPLPSEQIPFYTERTGTEQFNTKGNNNGINEQSGTDEERCSFFSPFFFNEILSFFLNHVSENIVQTSVVYDETRFGGNRRHGKLMKKI